MKLDHIMFAAAELQAGIDHVYALAGEVASPGGSHPGSGTCNALLALGKDQYLEIIAPDPDPDQDPAGTMAEELLTLAGPGIRTWAAATRDLDVLVKAVESAGYGYRVTDMSRTRPDGVHLAWQLLFVTGHPFGPALPFFINWLDSQHPATDTPGKSRLVDFLVQCEAANDLRQFCRSIDLEISTATGPLAFRADLQTPVGSVVLV